jgi:hypothetical protein
VSRNQRRLAILQACIIYATRFQAKVIIEPALGATDISAPVCAAKQGGDRPPRSTQFRMPIST